MPKSSSSALFSIGMYLCLFILLATTASVAQAPLSANSGINATDTYVVFDASVQSQGTFTFPQAVRDPHTGVASTNIPLAANVAHYHVEAGFDTADQLVMNIVSTDATADPTTTVTDGVGQIRIAGGKMTVVDQAGNVVPLVLPQNAPLPNPLALLGLRPGPTVLSGIVVNNVNTFAQSIQAAVVMQGGTPQTANLTTSAASIPNATSVMSYRQTGAVWTIAQMTITPAFANAQATRVVNFSGVGWNTNATGDARRAAVASTATAPPAISTSAVPMPTPLPADTTTPSVITETGTSTGPNVLFQHGIFSSGSTWSRMDNWLSGTFNFNTKLIPNLPSTNGLHSQAATLINQIASSGKNHFLLIGHSQGGLIGRDVAQQRPDLVQGVITVDTPHGGAQLALAGEVGLNQAFSSLFNGLFDAASCDSFFNPACVIDELLAGYSSQVINFTNLGFPAIDDLVPGSPFLTTLNSHAETFPRVGIEGHSKQRWVLMRLGGDFLGGKVPDCTPESGCGGQAFYTYTQITYFSLRACELFAFIFGDYSLGFWCGNVADYMDFIDIFYNLEVSFLAGSDGIVQNSGQVYPGSPTARYVINDADSHVGATRSKKVRDALIQTLDRQFFVPRAGCVYTISTPTNSFQFFGGKSPVTISTGTTCRWSAESDVPWIIILTPQTGTGAGTVTFAVDMNLTPAARTGTLTVAGLPPISITESGIAADADIGGLTISGGGFIGPIWDTPCTGRTKTSCTQYFNSGTISVTANGHANSISYGQGVTSQSLSYNLAQIINNDASASVNAGVIGTTVFLVSRVAGGMYPYSAVSTHFDSTHFPSPAFAVKTLGPNLAPAN